MREEAVFGYWGKAGKNGDSYHLLPYHSLDVAACGVVLLECHPPLRRLLAGKAGSGGCPSLRLARLFPGPPRPGQIQSPVPGSAPGPVSAVATRAFSGAVFHVRHDTLGWRLWTHLLAEPFIDTFVGAVDPRRPAPRLARHLRHLDALRHRPPRPAAEGCGGWFLPRQPLPTRGSGGRHGLSRCLSGALPRRGVFSARPQGLGKDPQAPLLVDCGGGSALRLAGLQCRPLQDASRPDAPGRLLAGPCPATGSSGRWPRVV
jgi:hypothetical protein